MKRKVERLELSRETVRTLGLQAATGGFYKTYTVQQTECVTNCPLCGNTNYITCVGVLC